MFINPTLAVKNNALRGLTNAEKQIQPNAVDFTLDVLKRVASDEAYLSEDKKTMRTLVDVETDENGDWVLEAGKVYDGTSNVFAEVPTGAAAVLFTRSTLTRNGVFLTSGLYDSGFKGHVGFTLYTVGGPLKIKKGTRVGQIAFISAASAKEYAGGYNHQQGTHYAEPVAPGQRQIAGNPLRTETGMGAILNPTGSEFL